MSHSNPVDISRAWMEAIQSALQVLNQQHTYQPPPSHKPQPQKSHKQQPKRQTPKNKTKKNPGSIDNDIDNDIDAWRKQQHDAWKDSADQLASLQKALWTMVPSQKNPSTSPDSIMMMNQQTTLSTALDTPPTEFPPGYINNSSNRSNHDPAVDVDDDDDAGDTIIDQQPLSTEASIPSLDNTPMTIRRLLIRVLTGQAEIWVAYGRWWPKVLNPASLQERINGVWEHVTPLAEQAIPMGRQALELADAAVSLWWEQQQTHYSSSSQQRHHQKTYQALVQDAETVALCVMGLSDFHQSLLQSMDKARHKLEDRLQPQWESRDQAKARLGDKWTSNPNPKGDYAKRRHQDERNLRALTTVLEKVQTWEVSQLSTGAQTLQYRLHGTTSDGDEDDYNMMDDWTMYYGRGDRDGGEASTPSADTKHDGQRFNGYRPRDVSRRVPWKDYPDPTNFGWTFTGSVEQSKVEFFEKDMVDQGTDIHNFTTTRVRLDWYYTTATVKTSFVHPKHNKATQLFGARVSPQVYRQILENPRSHTGQRYHQRQRNPRSPQKSKNKKFDNKKANRNNPNRSKNNFRGKKPSAQQRSSSIPA